MPAPWSWHGWWCVYFPHSGRLGDRPSLRPQNGWWWSQCPKESWEIKRDDLVGDIPTHLKQMKVSGDDYSQDFERSKLLQNLNQWGLNPLGMTPYSSITKWTFASMLPTQSNIARLIVYLRRIIFSMSPTDGLALLTLTQISLQYKFKPLFSKHSNISNPFQWPWLRNRKKLKVPTIHKAYLLGLNFRKSPPNNTQHMARTMGSIAVPSHLLGSRSSPSDFRELHHAEAGCYW